MHPSRSMRVGLLLGVALLPAGCGSMEPEEAGSLEGPWRAELDTIADTVVVRTVSGSRWGTARLVEELRIGRIEGDEHEMFGQVGALAVTSSGELLIYDTHAAALRRYGPDGSYYGTISSAGSGPGEYRNVAGIAVLEDGRIIVNDFGNGRFNVYSPDGESLDTWPVRAAIAAMRPLHGNPDGGVFLHDARQREGRRDRDEILVRLDGNGVPRDTMILPSAGHRPPSLEVRSETQAVGLTVPFSPVWAWSVTADGEVLAMAGHRYAVDVHRSDGSVLRIQRVVAPVPVSAEERAAEEDRVRAFFGRFVEHWSWDGPAIPTIKPPIQWLHTGQDGAIWVRVARPGRAIPEAERAPGARTFVHEPLVLDVFEPDGTFLGQVHAPDELRLQPYPVFGRDHVWAVVQDDSGVNFVSRLRIARSRTESQ
jgi:hypothetical protein